MNTYLKKRYTSSKIKTDKVNDQERKLGLGANTDWAGTVITRNILNINKQIQEFSGG